MIPRTLARVSGAFVAIERLLLMALVAMIAILVLMNVLLRVFGVTIAWADEVGIYAMILSGFVGASLMLRARNQPAVLLLHEFVPEPVRRVLNVTVSMIASVFGVTMLWLCWRWFDPTSIAAAGFDVPTFEGATFNFIYSETTPVMSVPAFWFYMVMPWFALTITVHALANLSEDLGLTERPADPARLAMDAPS